MKIKNQKSIKGFTLVELMVSTAIFMVVMLAAMGALFISSNSAKKSQALRSAMDNVNFAMDSMSRTLRTGTIYDCDSSGSGINVSSITPNDCPNGGSALGFVDAGGANTVYVLTGTTLQKYVSSTASYTAMTSPDIKITDLRFFVNGSSPTDTVQPSVYILMKGTVTVDSQTTTFALQTLASQRSAE